MDVEEYRRRGKLTTKSPRMYMYVFLQTKCPAYNVVEKRVESQLIQTGTVAMRESFTNYISKRIKRGGGGGGAAPNILFKLDKTITV